MHACKMWICFSPISILSKRTLSKCSICPFLLSIAFYCEIMDCELTKQIVWSLPRNLSVVVLHLESNASESGFMLCEGIINFVKSGLMVKSNIPDSKVRGTNMGPTWVLSAPDGTHVGPTNLAIGDVIGNKAQHHTSQRCTISLQNRHVYCCPQLI